MRLYDDANVTVAGCEMSGKTTPWWSGHSLLLEEHLVVLHTSGSGSPGKVTPQIVAIRFRNK